MTLPSNSSRSIKNIRFGLGRGRSVRFLEPEGEGAGARSARASLREESAGEITPSPPPTQLAYRRE